MEIERKFLVREPPADLARHPAQRIEQGYLVADGGVELRVRRRAGRATLTVKQGEGLVRAEEEIPIGQERFRRLWALTEGRRVEKVRHLVPDGGLTLELDVYGGALAGLVVAEVEFDSLLASAAFEPPAWLGDEVTGDARFANRTLACEGSPLGTAAYRLAGGEGVPAGLRRIARGRLDEAIGRLDSAGAETLGTAVHEARKSLKRARTTLRLWRDGLGDDVYRRENTALRDAGRRLSVARDSQVMVEALEALVDRHRDELEPGSFAALRGALARDHAAAQRRLRADAGTVQATVAELRAARARSEGWTSEGEGLDALEPGYRRLYRRGRKALRSAQDGGGDEALHELRKRVKDLWYAGEILRSKKTASRASDLSDVIGEDHDLAVLAETVERHRATLTDAEHVALAEMIAARRAKLQRRALKDARRLYRRKPRAAVRRAGLRRGQTP